MQLPPGNLLRALCACAWLILATDAAFAQQASSPGSDAGDASSGLLSDIWNGEALTGGWDGVRDRWADDGILLGADTIDEIMGNASGGARSGATYQGRLEVLATIDLQKTLGWDGATFHANAYQIHGTSLSPDNLGNNLLVASNIEADRSTRLFDLWIEQLLDKGKISLRAGQIAIDDEFFISDGASNFINATFGWPAVMSQALPSGGAAYPLATPGIRLNYAMSDSTTWMTALTSGNPAGPGDGDPQQRDASGLAFRTDGGAFLITEMNYRSSLNFDYGPLSTSYKLGGWFHSGNFHDLRFDTSGRSLASSATTGIPASLSNDYGIYFSIDQTLWQDPDAQDQGLSAFVRGGWTPPDRNEIALYFDGGFVYKGLFPGFPNDVSGIAFAFAKVGQHTSDLDRDERTLQGLDVPVRDNEAVVEITHHFQVTQWWAIQPDVQFVLHPGADGPRPGQMSKGLEKPIPDATILGARSSIVF